MFSSVVGKSVSSCGVYCEPCTTHNTQYHPHKYIYINIYIYIYTETFWSKLVINICI